MNKDDLLEIYKNARNEASDLNVEELLKAINNSKNDYLENKTLKIIAEEIVEEVFKLPAHAYTHEKKLMICDTLKIYRYVGAVNELRFGVFIKAYRAKEFTSLDPNVPARPIHSVPIVGTLLSVRFGEKGVYLSILKYRARNRLASIIYDNYTIFQVLTPDERLILSAYNMLETGNTSLPDDSDIDCSTVGNDYGDDGDNDTVTTFDTLDTSAT
jgi:hypothetical protein